MLPLRKDPRHWVASITLVAALGLLAFGVLGYFKQYQATHNSQAIIPLETVTHSTDTPDETPLDEVCAAYTVAAAEPRALELPSVGITGCVQKVGLDQHNAIAVPTNIHLAGWYTGSVLPGEPGLSIIDGHVRGRYRDGIFVALERTQPGELVRVQRGDGSWQEFRVVRVDRYPVEQAAAELFAPLENIERQLTLVTCGGAYDEKTGGYPERIFVRAVAL